MKSIRLCIVQIAFVAFAGFLFSAGAGYGQNQPKLVAPVYTGATSLGCSSGDYEASCTFATKDALDTVKAFYAKAVGGLHEAKNGFVMVFRSGKATEGEGTTSTVFATARIAGLPAVKMPPASDPKAGAAAGQLKYLGVMSRGIGWTQGGHVWSAEELKRTGFRAPDEFYKVFQQYRHLESSFYPGAQADEARQRYDAKISAINKRYEQAGEQSGRRAQSNFDQMMKNQARQQQGMQRQAEEDCKRGPTAQQKADHEELGRIIKKNSAERYKRFQAATEKMKSAGCGPMQPGSPGMQAGMEVGQIMMEDPEAMEFAKKMQARDAASRPKNTSADAFVKETQSAQEQGPKQMNEQWQAGLEYLAALDKIAYRTRISISGEKFGADAGGIVTDRAKVEDLWSKRKADVAEEEETEDRGTGRPAAKSPAGGKSAGSAPAKSAQSAPASKPPAKQPEKSDSGISTDDAVKAGKEGFNALKKLF